MSSPQNTRLGIALTIAACALFAIQDALTRMIGNEVPVFMLVMLRFWFFGVMVIALALRKKGGLRAASRSAYPIRQILRGLLLMSEICLMVVAFLHLGLINTHAMFVAYPLLVVILSGPILGEKIGWRRWAAVAVGFIGVLIIINPNGGIFDIWALVAFSASLMFAVYGLLTRYVAREDSPEVSFFWTGIIGALASTPLGIYYWQEISAQAWMLVAVLCVISMISHGIMIKAYDVAEASMIQPFAYFQLPFVSVLGVWLFGEALHLNVVFGAMIVVGAGLFTLWRARVREKEKLG